MGVIAPGLEGVVVGETRLSRVDGQAGRLLLAGFPVEVLAPCAAFEETVFLLWHDRLPDARELAELRRELAARREIAPWLVDLLRRVAREGVPAMDALRLGVAGLAAAHPDLREVELRRERPEANRRRALRLVAALPTLAAAHLRLAAGRAPVAPDPDPELGHAANYLWMLSGRRPEAASARALETYFNATADHGLNASTFAARVIASTRSDLASAVEGALGALKGPLHGGAPGPALDMVFEVRAEATRTGRSLGEVAEAWVRRTVEAGGRIMGFGHRVYRVRDPRADALAAALERLFPKQGGEAAAQRGEAERSAGPREASGKAAAQRGEAGRSAGPREAGGEAAAQRGEAERRRAPARGGESPLYDDARAVETAVRRVLAELKPGRRLDTNVEFYTALLLHTLGLPASAFTATFAVARVVGWTAHVLEQIAEDRLIRPSAAWAGGAERRWVPLEERKAAEPPRSEAKPSEARAPARWAAEPSEGGPPPGVRALPGIEIPA